ncbi:dual specificity protein phosphatase family protein [Agrobacterium rosae]|uniref:Dual specificity protein phosphatase family protein n=1 Tax=Agrobacterium rosae TaxID=1972867 RepID=A0AAW9F7J7_9HYPH|nr:dual specificity protein phosphatase family protein [Agrobacterium rosae]MDX8301440.1 dual specificity protein phosphatase family protein [Agrobacterium rosae]MDX8312954.1 dual specificity protein phosphatase family protein [Agrobacterium rosae]POO57839.1 tyrosine protein phosphatase [Agrobacterium rosae]
MVSVSRVLKIGVLCLVALPASVGAHMGINQLTGNFHEVLPGELYRSGQPSGADVTKYAQQFGIKTIINLRNEDRKDWYRDEKAAADASGVKLIDFPLSSSKELPQDQAEELVRLMKDAPKPILIHCEHGANRTGLASAIYVGAVAKKSEQAAEFQLSPYYGHVPIKGVGRYEMYQSWDDFEETIGF